MAYITYQEYQNFGGKANETTFNKLINIVESKLNFNTNGRIQLLDEVPQEVKTLCVQLVDTYSYIDMNRDPSITSYSNGIESFSFDTSKDSVNIESKTNNMIREWLWKYPELLYRGRKQWKQKS